MMAHRLTIRATVADAEARRQYTLLRQSFPHVQLEEVSLTTAYTIDASLTAAERRLIAAELTNPVTEEASFTQVLAPRAFRHAIEISFLPGVTDNVGTTAQQMVADALDKQLGEGNRVYSSRFVFLQGPISRSDARAMASALHNPLIERATVHPATAVRKKLPIAVPKVTMRAPATADEVSLELPDAELARLGKEGIANRDGSRRGPLALGLAELHAIRDYFRTQKRKPTDIELESLAQTWSEHCKHTIFNDPLDDISEGLYRRYIRRATEDIRRAKGTKDFCISVFTDNAGAVAFDDEFMVSHKMETHNTPSALDPYGGSMTGILGVNRDALGFGLAAKPIANIYGFCVGRPADRRQLFRDRAKQQPLLLPKRILEGVVRGINVGGNQSGIPTPLGFVYVDDCWRGKPLVFAGTVGLLPRKSGGRLAHRKRARPGDYIVMIGGRVGLDGIHGATFSSETLDSGSPATAVQIGDPITQKKVTDALLREARDAGLYSSITDNGAGGLSCSVAEMARECGGCVVNLEQVPLKYPGIAPWQIWISESQERMTLAVPPQKWIQLQALLKTYDVEGTRIGTFTKDPTCVVKHGKKTLMKLSMEFLHEGLPPKQQQSRLPQPAAPRTSRRSRARVTLKEELLKLLARPSIGSYAFISQQYDHEVQGTAVTKPLQGPGRVNADATVIRPVPSSPKGVVLSHALYPHYSESDPYAMAAASIDTAVRNVIAAGGTLSHLALLDNFCWSSGNDPERLHQLKEAARACYDTAVAYGTPYISGKDSMFNNLDAYTEHGKAVHVASLPTLLISALSVVPRAEQALTLETTTAGNSLYLLGATDDELGGSEYALQRQEQRDHRFDQSPIPLVDAARNKKLYTAVTRANRQHLIAAAKSVTQGGLVIAASKMAVAGQLGLTFTLPTKGSATTPEAKLFAESQGRLLVEVPRRSSQDFEALMRKATVPCQRIGRVTKEPRFSLKQRGRTKPLLSASLAELTKAYRKPFRSF